MVFYYVQALPGKAGESRTVSPRASRQLPALGGEASGVAGGAVGLPADVVPQEVRQWEEACFWAEKVHL